MMATLKRAGKAAAALLPIAELARLGVPALAALFAFAMLVLAMVCWVLSSEDRCRRLALVIRAWHGETASAPGSLSPPAVPRPHPRRKRLWNAGLRYPTR